MAWSPLGVPGGGTRTHAGARGATWGGAGRLGVPWGCQPQHQGPPPHFSPPPGWLWLRLAHLPPLRQVLPGGPAALLHGGLRHRRRHLPKGGSFPWDGWSVASGGARGGAQGPPQPPPVSCRPCPRTRWSDCPSTTSRRGGTTRLARRRGTGVSPAPSPRTPPPTVSPRTTPPRELTIPPQGVNSPSPRLLGSPPIMGWCFMPAWLF